MKEQSSVQTLISAKYVLAFGGNITKKDLVETGSVGAIKVCLLSVALEDPSRWFGAMCAC